MNDIILNIDSNILNIFSNKEINDLIKELKLNNYYEVKQTHSDIVYIIDDNYINNSVGDALITNQKNTPIIIKIADCIPILIYDKENKVISLVHSGWKGPLKNITIKTIETMISKYNSKKENIYVYIYPSIRQCHFEIQEDVYSLFKETITNIDKYTNTKEGHCNE